LPLSFATGRSLDPARPRNPARHLMNLKKQITDWRDYA
jgi:hypothetical protein